MKKMCNEAHIEGRVYEHSLAIKQVQNKESDNFGKDFINGTLRVATDEAGLNVVDVHFSYVTPTTKKGSANATYKALESIINGATWLANGPEQAIKVAIDTTIALNDFYDNEGKLVSPKRLEGGFVTIVTALNPVETARNTFSVDIVITNVKRVEATEENKIKADYDIIHGAVFDFRGAMLPMDFNIRDEAGMGYFEGLDASGKNPVFTKFWGNIISESIEREVVTKSAFGTNKVDKKKSSHKEYLISGSAEEIGVFDDESTILASELAKATQDREVYLADVKKRADDYKANKGSGVVPPAASVQSGSFNF